MALTDAEIQRCRYELGYVNMSTAAEPYIGIAAIFDAVIKPYTLGGASTTSTTPVTAATTPTPTSLVLASATGFAAGAVVVLDVDARQERATIQSTSGSTITVQLSSAHTGTYPVVVEGGESIIRDLLVKLRSISDSIDTLRSRAGIKAIVGDVEFFGGGGTLASQGIDPVTQLLSLREMWRDELAWTLGLTRRNDKRNSGGSDIGMY